MMGNAKAIGKPGRTPRHGQTGLYAKSDSALRIRAERVRRIVANMRKACPWLTPADAPAMKGWAELEVLSATVFAWLLKLNVLTGAGEPRRLLDQHRQLKLAQLSYEVQLGMTPLSRAALKLSTTGAAFDISPEMIANVNEVGASRRREREAKEQAGGDGDKIQELGECQKN
jgi:hypothetical protein